jgi:hypothetical protein
MRLFPSTNSKSFIEVAQDFLMENTLSGAQVQVVELGRASVLWQSPSSSSSRHDESGVAYEAVSFTQSLPIGSKNVTFFFSAKLFKADSTLQYGLDQIAVLKNELEFSINITNWPFRSMENTLTYGITVDSRGGGKTKKGKLPTLDDTRGRTRKDASYIKPQKEALFDTGNLLAPTTAIVDGVERDITIQIGVKQSLRDKKEKTLITFQFPAFEKTLFYDPILSALPGVSWELVAFSALGISLLAVCFFKYCKTGVRTQNSAVDSLHVKASVQKGRSYHAVTVLSPADAPVDY